MELESYPMLSGHRHEVYEFVSRGPSGAIRKVVQYKRIRENLFNLAFGDWDTTLKKMNDSKRTNNHDSNLVLMTVACPALDFF